MVPIRIFERAQKYATIGRFDFKSGVSYMNDALYDIAKRQSLTIDETVYGFYGAPVFVSGIASQIESIYIENGESYRARINNDSSISLFRNTGRGFVEITPEDNLQVPEIKVRYVGYIPINPERLEQNYSFPQEFETAIVYFIRYKILEEMGQHDQANHFMQSYHLELNRVVTPRKPMKSEPSQYSLL